MAAAVATDKASADASVLARHVGYASGCAAGAAELRAMLHGGAGKGSAAVAPLAAASQGAGDGSGAEGSGEEEAARHALPEDVWV